MSLRLVHWSDPVTVAVDVAAWAVVHAGTGYLVHRLPATRLGGLGWWWQARPFERDGRFYAERLHIGRWKDRLPEAGALFPGGVSKRSLAEAGGPGRLALETRRAELGHWLAMVPGPVFVLWNPPGVAVAMVVYGVAVNLPFVAIQRYNRLRLERVARRVAGRAAPG